MHGSLQFKIAVTVVPYKKKNELLVQQSINTGDILQVFMSLLTGIHTKKFIVLACMISATNMMADQIKTFKSP